jgi:hypothetical protein
MILIQRDALYTRQDLAELLEPAGVDVDTFISKIKPRRVLRALYRGSDLLTAWDSAMELSEPMSLPAAKNSGNRKRRSSPTKGNLIGGVFTPEDIGLAK